MRPAKLRHSENITKEHQEIASRRIYCIYRTGKRFGKSAYANHAVSSHDIPTGSTLLLYNNNNNKHASRTKADKIEPTTSRCPAMPPYSASRPGFASRLTVLMSVSKALDSPIRVKRGYFFLIGGHGPDSNPKSLDFGHLTVSQWRTQPKGEPDFRFCLFTGGSGQF